MKSNSVMTFAYDAPTRTLSWLFRDGATMEFCMDDAAPSAAEYAAVHGFKQKIGDAAAMGMGTSQEEKRAAMQKVAEQLRTSWNAPAGSGGGGGGLVAQAIANVDGKDLAKVREFLKGKTAAQRGAFAAHKRYAKEYKRLQDAALVAKAAGVDIADELTELDNL